MSGRAPATLEASSDLPHPYCETRWKQALTALGVSATIALAIAIEMHFLSPPTEQVPEPPMTAPVAAAERTRVAVRPVGMMQPSPVLPSSPTPGVEFARETEKSRASAALPYPGLPRTAFNISAQRIRPSVIGVRALVGRGSRMERIGSGVIIDPAGYAVTCNHVVDRATSISVSRFTAPEKQLPARLVAVENDLALLQISDVVPFKAATLANSDLAQIGDWVLAVGHPFGLGLTVTAGIVGRRDGDLQIPGGPRYTGLIQTDAPINEGSSGGPLVNLAGEVIGLNTAIYAPTGVFSGAGFAIPSNRIRRFLARTLPEFSAAPPAPPAALWGLQLETMTAPDARRLAFPYTGGALVTAVQANSSAAEAGIAVNDIVTSINGRAVMDAQAARSIYASLGAGSEARIQIWRHNQSTIVTLPAATTRPRATQMGW